MMGRTHALVDSLSSAPIESTLVFASPTPPPPAAVPSPPPPTEQPRESPKSEQKQEDTAPLPIASPDAISLAANMDALDTPRRPATRAPSVPTPVIAPTPMVAAAPSTPTGGSPITFAGVAAERATRIVYVVDASGPMASSLPFVVDELARSLESLAPSQQFQVVLFRSPPASRGEPAQDEPGFEMFPGSSASLLQATRDTKDRVHAWLAGVRSSGRSDPLPGLKAALSMKPDLVFLLSRSIKRSGPTRQWGAGASAILSTLDKLNPVSRVSGQRPCVIKTIQFLDDDPTGLLRSIASVHGDGAGSYRVLELAELTGPRVSSVSEQP